MFNTPQDQNDWRPVNAQRPQTSVNVNRNVSIGHINNNNTSNSNSKEKDFRIKPKIVNDQVQGKVVDVRTKNVQKKK